jgi:hypothetical protein
MRLGLFDQVKRLLEKSGIGTFKVEDLQTPEGRRRILPRPPAELQAILDDYGKVAVAYDFDLEITEQNKVDAGLSFKLPFAGPSVLDIGAAGALGTTRVGRRTFTAQETFTDLILRNDWCDGFKPRDKNHLYPITGSIGLRKVVETFIALSEQGGGKDSFVDSLAFTTTIGGSLNPSLKLSPVPNAFRLVEASAGASAGRTDLHRVKISLAFPVPEPPRPKHAHSRRPIEAPESGTVPFVYNPVWRARYNICVADARDREELFKTLRLSPPEVYCLSYADAFVPRTLADTAPPSPPPTPIESSAPRAGRPLAPSTDTPTRRGVAPPVQEESPPPSRAEPPPRQQPRTRSWW